MFNTTIRHPRRRALEAQLFALTEEKIKMTAEIDAAIARVSNALQEEAQHGN